MKGGEVFIMAADEGGRRQMTPRDYWRPTLNGATQLPAVLAWRWVCRRCGTFGEARKQVQAERRLHAHHASQRCAP